MKLSNVQKKIKKFLNGFTLIELTISVAVIAILSVFILTSYRKGEKVRSVVLGTDIIASAMRAAQSLTLNPKQIETTCSLGNQAKDYRLVFTTNSNTFTLVADDKCAGVIPIETYKFPQNVLIPENGLLHDTSGGLSAALQLRFTPPFSTVDYSVNGNDFFKLRKALISVASSDGSLTKYVTYNAASGKVDVTDNANDVYFQ